MLQNGEMVGVRGMNRRQRDLLRLGLDRLCIKINPKVFTLANVDFHPLTSRTWDRSQAGRNDVQVSACMQSRS